MAALDLIAQTIENETLVDNGTHEARKTEETRTEETPSENLTSEIVDKMITSALEKQAATNNQTIEKLMQTISDLRSELKKAGESFEETKEE